MRHLTTQNTILIISIISLSLTLPFLNKAFYIDVYPYIKAGQWLEEHHFRFEKILKKDWNWEGEHIPTYAATHPPLFYLMVGSAIYLIKKPNEVKLHIISLLFVLLAAISMFFVAKRFTKYPLLTSLLLVGSPAFLTISLNIIPDIPMLALSLATIWPYLSAIENRKKSLFVLSGIIATFMCLISYQGLYLILLLFIYPFVNRKRFSGETLTWIIPIFAFAIWCIFVYSVDKVFILFTAPTMSVQNDFFNIISFTKKFIGYTASVGGTTIFTLILLFVFAKKRKFAFFFIFILTLIFVFILAHGYSLLEKLLLIIFLSTGFIVTWEFMYVFSRKNIYKTPEFLLLALWYLGFLVAAGIFLPFASTRYLTFILPPLIILFVKEIENYGVLFRMTALILTIISGLSMATSDYQRAGIYRQFAKSLNQEFKGNKNIWFVGGWGVRYYLEQEGYKYLLFDNDTIPQGSIIIRAGMPAYYFNKMPTKMKSILHFVKRITYRAKFPIRLMDTKCHAGFYSNEGWQAFLPYSFSTGPLDYFDIYRVGRPNYFINRLNIANIETKIKGFRPVLTQWTMNNIPKNVIFEHPPTKLFYKIHIPERSKLSFSIGMDPQVWHKSMGDGVEFIIKLGTRNSELRTLFSKYIDPKNNPKDRKWHNEEVDLSEYGGKEVTLTFITTCGPKGNCNYDWAGWGEPEINEK